MEKQVFVRRERERWGLTQEELATLLGLSRSSLSRVEAGIGVPDLPTAFGLQVIFGKSAHRLFPGLYTDVEERVMRQGTRLDGLCTRLRTGAALLKQRLLSQMVGRVRNGFNCA